MHSRKTSVVIILVCLIAAGFVTAGAQTKSSAGTPVAVLRELYKVHNKGNGPVFLPTGKRNIYKYFDRKLADLIWKDLTQTPDDEIGRLDFDPLYNAQDIQASNLRFGTPVGDKQKVVVAVSFLNYGDKNLLKFHMRNTSEGWKVENIVYDETTNLLGIMTADQ